eukprot:1937184-Alexandrium_andersonii.AAC.1
MASSSPENRRLEPGRCRAQVGPPKGRPCGRAPPLAALAEPVRGPLANNPPPRAIAGRARAFTPPSPRPP